jgi:hypothetical protein
MRKPRTSPHYCLKQLFITRLKEELNIEVSSSTIKGCGRNANGVMPAPHVYGMTWGFYPNSKSEYPPLTLFPAIQALFEECCTDPALPEPMTALTPPPTISRYGGMLKPRSDAYEPRYQNNSNPTNTIRFVQVTVCTLDYAQNRKFYDQQAIDTFDAANPDNTYAIRSLHEKERKARLHFEATDPDFLREKAERDRKAEEEYMRLEAARRWMETPDGVAYHLSRWQEEGLLPALTHIPHLRDHILCWKHVVTSTVATYDASKPFEHYNVWPGELGAPHIVGQPFTYGNVGNACCGPYGALKRSPIYDPSLAPEPYTGPIRHRFGGYVAAIAVRPGAVIRTSTLADGHSSLRLYEEQAVLIDHHSDGVLTFSEGFCLAVYEGSIDPITDDLSLRLIEGIDVLPLIQ